MMSLTTNCLIKYGSIASEKLYLKTLCIYFTETADQGFLLELAVMPR